MKADSYARVAFKILKYLNDCYENSLEDSIDSLNANMFGYFRIVSWKVGDFYKRRNSWRKVLFHVRRCAGRFCAK